MQGINKTIFNSGHHQRTHLNWNNLLKLILTHETLTMNVKWRKILLSYVTFNWTCIFSYTWEKQTWNLIGEHKLMQEDFTMRVYSEQISLFRYEYDKKVIICSTLCEKKLNFSLAVDSVTSFLLHGMDYSVTIFIHLSLLPFHQS